MHNLHLNVAQYEVSKQPRLSESLRLSIKGETLFPHVG
jgi:hypothetical protein